MSDSESSGLSSAPSDDGMQFKLTTRDGILKFVSFDGATDKTSSKETTPPAKKREPSPPHDYILADNPDIAFLVIFRCRFTDAFPKSLSHYGPQDIERGISITPPGEGVENLLCALLGLVLNRKKNPERGHFHRALEEAISTQKPQWPFSWEGASPLAGAKTFSSMTPTERLSLMKVLAMWSLSSSDAIQAKIKESYKQSRHNDDLNQPLSVQPWGKDGDKSRYWLIEGLDDTSFRVYRDTSPARVRSTWWSVAGSINDLKDLSETLKARKTQSASKLSDRINAAIPRFEATEEKRKRREYRIMRKQQFARPEPGFSLYEGRTRGKRMKYTFSDDDDDLSDEPSTHRSTRSSGVSTPKEPSDAPTFTASGRQVKSRYGGSYGETIVNARSSEQDSSSVLAEADSKDINGRARRSGLRQEMNGWAKGDDHIETYNSVDEMEDEEEAASSGADDPAGDFDDRDDGVESAGEDEEMSDADSIEEHQPRDRKLVVQLKVSPKSKTDSPDVLDMKHDGHITNGVATDQQKDPIHNGEASVNGNPGTPGSSGSGVKVIVKQSE